MTAGGWGLGIPWGRKPSVVKTGVPTIVAYTKVYVGHEYSLPFTAFAVDTSIPARAAEEWGIGGPAAVAPTAWVSMATEIKYWTVVDLGVQNVRVFVRNSFNTTGDFAEVQVDVRTAGWVTGEPKASLGAASVTMEEDPQPVNFRNLITSLDTATNVKVWEGSDDTGTLIYDGAFQSSMLNSTFFECAKVPGVSLYWRFTNATGSADLPSYLTLTQGVCP